MTLYELFIMIFKALVAKRCLRRKWVFTRYCYLHWYFTNLAHLEKGTRKTSYKIFAKWKNKWKNKNHILVKAGHTSEFLFGNYWWTWKNNYLLNKLLKRANKIYTNFNICNVVFFKKKTKKEKHLEISLIYTCVPTILMVWSTVIDQAVIECNMWETEIGNCVSFFALLQNPPI